MKRISAPLSVLLIVLGCSPALKAKVDLADVLDGAAMVTMDAAAPQLGACRIDTPHVVSVSKVAAGKAVPAPHAPVHLVSTEPAADFSALVAASRSEKASQAIAAASAAVGSQGSTLRYIVASDKQDGRSAREVLEALPSGATDAIAAATGWSADFVSELGPEDSVHATVAALPLDPTVTAPASRVLAWSVHKDGEQHDGFYFAAEGGKRAGYYDRNGKLLGDAPVAPPVADPRVTSAFAPSRLHPTLKRHMPHNGVDYGAATGTPVLAIADGEITTAGWMGVNGKLVKIDHDSHYNSHYAHLSKIAPEAAVGARVKKGQVIGYVGATGRVTGPHLHFAVSVDGNYVDPETVTLPCVESLHGDELARFRAEVERVDVAWARDRNAVDASRIAMATIRR